MMNSGRFCYRASMSVALAVLIMVTLLTVACAAPQAAKPASEPQDSGGLVIRYLTAPKQIMPSLGGEVLCVVTDESDGKLTYEWSATGGEIRKKGEDWDLVLWVAPAKTGTYTVTVAVTNAQGKKATRSVDILVTSEPSQSPVVLSVTCQDCKNSIEASRFSTYNIRCDAHEPTGGNLSYTWFATIGKIKAEGNGSSATWYTGGQYGNALITVIVSNDKGNKTEGYLAVNISCCK